MLAASSSRQLEEAADLLNRFANRKRNPEQAIDAMPAHPAPHFAALRPVVA